MNRKEFEESLRKMSIEEFSEFVKKFGGDHSEPNSIIRQYANHPEWEPRLCQLLGFMTEEERKTEAALRSASAAKWSAISAAVSALIAFILMLITLFIRNTH